MRGNEFHYYRFRFFRRLLQTLQSCRYIRDYCMIYRGSAFLCMNRLLANPLPLSRQQDVSLSQSSCVSPLELTGGRGGGGGEEPNHTTVRKPGPL